jgi:hypothetical protein
MIMHEHNAWDHIGELVKVSISGAGVDATFESCIKAVRVDAVTKATEVEFFNGVALSGTAWIFEPVLSAAATGT